MSWIQEDLTFEEEKHVYKWQGVPALGTTSLFDRIGYRKDDQSPWNPIGLPDFAKREHDSNFGSAFHKIPEIVFKGGIPQYPESMEPWVSAFNQFVKKHPLTPMVDQCGNRLVEYPMYSVKYGYAGTLDLFARNEKGELILLDWKTSTSYQKSYSLQTAAYEQLVREVFEGVLFPKRSKIIRITVLINPIKHTVFQRDSKNGGCDFNNFLSILNTYRIAA